MKCGIVWTRLRRVAIWNGVTRLQTDSFFVERGILPEYLTPGPRRVTAWGFLLRRV